MRREDLRDSAVGPGELAAPRPAIRGCGRAASRPGCRSRRRSSPRAPARPSRRPARCGGTGPAPSARCPPRTDLTHSAPARVLPAPRPPMITQVRQSPSGASWWAWPRIRTGRAAPAAPQPSGCRGTPSARWAALRRSSLPPIEARAAPRSSFAPAAPPPRSLLCCLPSLVSTSIAMLIHSETCSSRAASIRAHRCHASEGAAGRRQDPVSGFRVPEQARPRFPRSSRALARRSSGSFSCSPFAVGAPRCMRGRDGRSAARGAPDKKASAARRIRLRRAPSRERSG